MSDKRERAITCVFCRDLHLTSTFSGLLQTDLFKGRYVWRNGFSNQIIVTFVTQGLPSSFLLRPIAHVHY